MSKKIIYLLSLLMALSLVFASCKKNNPLDAGGNSPEELPQTNVIVGENGLYQSWDKIKDETLIKNLPLVGAPGADYYRNPVIVAMKEGVVAVFTEKRYGSPGADNDIGVDGKTPVNIVYAITTDAGDTDFGAFQVVGGGSDTAPEAANSHSAAVVFKASKDTVVVVASAGVGISRVNELYGDRGAGMVSKVQYIVGTLSGDNKSFTWSTAGWKDVKDNMSTFVEAVNAGNNVKYNQFGTHSARGYVTDEGTAILPVIIAQQGGYKAEGGTKEMMGAIFFSAKIDGASTSSDLVWSEMNRTVAFQNSGDNFSKYKEVRTVGGTTTAPKYFVVPSPDKTANLGKGSIENNTVVTAPTDSGIPASEGSPAYIALPVNGWYGTSEYNPAKYANTPGTAGVNDAAGINMGIYMHVIGPKGIRNRNLNLRLLDPTSYTVKSTQPMFITETSKSSSVDVLPDGTIIAVIEKEQITGVSGLKYKIYYLRMTQKYIAEQTQTK